jgi:hypothetical protein
LNAASVHGQKFVTGGQARQAGMNWMTRHDHRRLHSTQGYLGPMQYGLRWCEAQRKRPRESWVGYPTKQEQHQKANPGWAGFLVGPWRHGGTMERAMGIEPTS